MGDSGILSLLKWNSLWRPIILCFLNATDFYPAIFNWWDASSNELAVLNQIKNYQIRFTIGNPEEYLVKNNFTKYDTIEYYTKTPLIRWKQISSKNNLENFIRHYNIKYFFFKKGSKIPDFIINRQKKIIISEKTKSKFILL